MRKRLVADKTSWISQVRPLRPRTLCGNTKGRCGLLLEETRNKMLDREALTPYSLWSICILFFFLNQIDLWKCANSCYSGEGNASLLERLCSGLSL